MKALNVCVNRLVELANLEDERILRLFNSFKRIIVCSERQELGYFFAAAIQIPLLPLAKLRDPITVVALVEELSTRESVLRFQALPWRNLTPPWASTFHGHA